MGSGEYGGNGSVHWRGSHTKDRNHGHNPFDYLEVDETPSSGRNFTVTIFDIPETDVQYNAGTKTLTAKVRIKHHSKDYTRQVLVQWPGV